MTTEIDQLKTALEIERNYGSRAGKLAFYHRHMALLYVGKVNPELKAEASIAAYAQTKSRFGCNYEDYVLRLEGQLAQATDLLNRAADHYEAMAEEMRCDAGNWDGGSAASCEHCQFLRAAEAMRTFLDGAEGTR